MLSVKLGIASARYPRPFERSRDNTEPSGAYDVCTIARSEQPLELLVSATGHVASATASERRSIARIGVYRDWDTLRQR